jgi:glyoxylase-like metal-dependent hydrolase (beta-lactamase superfamily II)
MTVRIADRWFERRRIDDDITLLWEPHVDPLIRCNIWHVRGRDLDLLIDTGMGIVSLRSAAADLFDKPLTAVATHSHYDHVGGLHEFDSRAIHRDEAQALLGGSDWGALRREDFSPSMIEYLDRIGYPVPATLLTAYPHQGFDPAAYRTPATTATRLLADGDRIDLGDRSFEVMHLPGHSPGSIGLWEAATGTLFSGDAVYDGPLLDELPGSDVAAYLRTVGRLRQLPVTVVHGGHDPSFDRARMLALLDDYERLVERRAAQTAAGI